MSRNISSTLRTAMYAPETGEVLAPLVELSRRGWVAPERLVANAQDVVHGGNTYTAMNFALTLPDDTDQGQPVLRFVTENISQTLIQKLRQNTRPVNVSARWVLLSDPNNVELELAGEIPEFSFDDSEISGVVTIEPVLEDPLMELRFTPEKFPGLFG